MDANAILLLPLILFATIFGGIMYVFPSTAPWIISLAIVISVLGMIINLIIFLAPFVFWGGILIGIIWLLSLL